MQEGGGGGQSDVIMGEGFHLPLLLLLAPKVGEGAVSPGTWAPLGAGKNKETDSSLRSSKRHQPCCHLTVAQRGPGGWTCDLQSC